MIVEYLTQQDVTPFGGGEERPRFTVDTTGPTEVTMISTAYSGFMRNGNGYRYFQPNDNLRVLSIGLVLPYSFSLSTIPIYVSYFWWDTTTAKGPIYEFTGATVSGNTVLPYDGAEFPVDIKIDHKSPGKNVAYGALFAGAFSPKVSMINAPSSLNGATLLGWFFWKVAHTLPMVTG